MSSDSGAPDRPANGRRRALSTPAVRIALSVLAIAASAALVLLSPFALRAYGPDGSDSDWQRVGNVAQAYGAVSALIAGLALAGVGASLVFQARESKANREQGMRTAHTELMRMAMTDPSLMACWGRLDGNASEESRRQHLYLNLVVSHWEMMFELGALSEGHLRQGADSIFSTVPARRFWAASRMARRDAASTRRARRFHQLVDERYVAATGPDSETE
ncbi:DUF6082 family protein [Streptomyces yerevanensis]|uniref:DUF6082 family protein n=1 Tax=Streptomyces yerevanensis TaxID=66378 RepID=UPI00068FC9D7|nr:DUF6082 family protein [Streptomyces yerevanensis]